VAHKTLSPKLWHPILVLVGGPSRERRLGAADGITEVLLQQLIDFLASKWLGKEAGNGQVLHPLDVLGVEGGSEHDDDGRVVGEQALGVGWQKLDSVHAGHFHIEQNEGRAGRQGH
jgi:hypothetical protein